MGTRLPTHLEVSALIRRVAAEGGFATVLARGESDAGALLVVLTQGGMNSRVYERMPQPNGARKWVLSRQQDDENTREFDEYLARRKRQDPDLWIIELDARDGERFIDDLPV